MSKVKYLNDVVANLILSDIDCRDYLISIVSKAIGIEEELIKENLTLVSNRVNENINTKYNYADNVFENNFSIINIEVNYFKGANIEIKNMRYICHLILKQTSVGEKYEKLKPIYQININNYDVFKGGKFIYKSILMEESLHQKRSEFMTIIDINIDFLRDIDYNKLKEEDSLEKLLYIFICDNKMILDKLYLNNRIMDEVRKKIDNIYKDFDYLLYYDHDEFINECSYEEGERQGIEKIAKTMLEKKMKIDDITEITGLTKDEIEKL